MKQIFLAMVSASFLLACANDDKTTKDETVNNVTAKEDSTGQAAWENLFDGKTLNGWHGYNKDGAAIKNWIIVDGALVCLGHAEHDSGGDIVTDKAYENFELDWDWKVDSGSNSGVMYHVVEDKKYNAPYLTGPEYQIIDDVNFPGKLEEWQKAGADYAMHNAGSNKKLKPVGEWNNSKIIFNKGKVEHWLNGEKIVAFEAWTANWNKLRETGKWKDFPDYGKAKTGLIALQDHGNKAYYKNIRIRKL
jgi:hypothetical protein